jgi:ubiquinone/menaquinone biosynthesis C-methylase UbiE
MTLSDPDFVAGQYRDASNLEARIALHRRFSAGEKPLPRWIFEQLDLPPDARILELGCGPGQLWSENEERIPDGWTVTLTDASPGMVRAARERLGPDRRMAFRVADAQDIPFRDGAFDAVIANHMLYHVPDMPRALSEVVRVLSPGGCLYAATNGECHMRELGPMRHVLDPSHPPDAATKEPIGFSLENGAAQLSQWFLEVSLRRYEDALVVTEAAPLVEYLLSGASADAAVRETGSEELARRAPMLRKLLDEKLAERGEIRITKDSGLFVARRPR